MAWGRGLLQIIMSFDTVCTIICLDLIVKNRKIFIEGYFKWWTSIKLV
jgi:hypothetical protein